MLDPEDFAIHRNLYFQYTELENESRLIHPTPLFPSNKKEIAVAISASKVLE